VKTHHEAKFSWQEYEPGKFLVLSKTGPDEAVKKLCGTAQCAIEDTGRLYMIEKLGRK
jgi:hypothetical protein